MKVSVIAGLFANVSLLCAGSVREKHGLVDLQELCPAIKVDARYATENNFTGKVVYRNFKGRTYLLKEPAEQLTNKLMPIISTIRRSMTDPFSNKYL